MNHADRRSVNEGFVITGPDYSQIVGQVAELLKQV